MTSGQGIAPLAPPRESWQKQLTDILLVAVKEWMVRFPKTSQDHAEMIVFSTAIAGIAEAQRLLALDNAASVEVKPPTGAEPESKSQSQS